MRRIAFLLGAGASKALGSDVKPGTPLMGDLYEELARAFPNEWGAGSPLEKYRDRFKAVIMPHTEMLHLISRFRRPDLGHLETEVTLNDPGTFTKPVKMKTISDLAANEDVQEWICNENNQDLEHLVGK